MIEATATAPKATVRLPGFATNHRPANAHNNSQGAATIASAANIGGVATASIVAEHHNERLLPAAVLMAMFGYAVGNFGAFAAGWLCKIVS